MGEDFQSTELHNKEQVQILEISGNPRYSALGFKYFQRADLIILCVNLAGNGGLSDAESRLGLINKFRCSDSRVVVIGTKSDLLEERKIEKDQLDHFSKENGLICIETSAKTGDGVSSMSKLIF
jgi:GTPase SAR1 family protein